MHITETLTSRQNPRVKNILRLQKYSERVRQHVFIIEGTREIKKALLSGYRFEAVYFNRAIIEPENIVALFGNKLPEQVFEVNDHVFRKIAYRENSGGLIVLAYPAIHTIHSLKLSANPLLLVVEGVEKPGNLGAIYRTADAAGIDGIILCNPGTDLYNPNTIRASLGCVFTVPTAITESSEAVIWLKSRNISVFSTCLQSAVSCYTIDFSGPSAIVMGTETTGISNEWVQSSDASIIIPMRGVVDSMNVSTSAAVLIFEACRQRYHK